MKPLVVGAGPIAGLEQVLDLGEGHPSAAGGFAIELETEGGLVSAARMRVGNLHRGAEKLFEARDYRQGLMLADRHDWYSPFAGELGLAMTIEAALGLPVPERASWIRLLLAELSRIGSHFGFAGYLHHLVPAVPSTRVMFADLLVLTELLTGNRLHPMYARLGGVAHDLDVDQLDAVADRLQPWRELADALVAGAESSEFTALTAGIGAVDRETAWEFGASGVVGRASGIESDLRSGEADLPYSELGFAPVVGDTRDSGDAATRFSLLTRELAQSIDLVEGALGVLRTLDGPVEVALPKIVRLPEGTFYWETESPLGAAGYLIVSDGDRAPYRLKIRSVSFAHAQLLEHILPGARIDDIANIVASMFLVVGDIDR